MFNKDGYIIPEKKVIPVKEWKSLSDDEIIKDALISGFMLNTAYGQDESKLMPVSDTKTLTAFARAIEQALKELNAKK